MAGKSSDGALYVELVFSALAAILSAPADSRATYQKKRWLLLNDSAAETATIAGALGETMTFPVSR